MMVTATHHTLFSAVRARSAGPHRTLPDAGSPGAPHSVWIAPPHAIKTPIATGTELPIWAFEAACAEYAPLDGAVAVMPGPATSLAIEYLVPASLAPSWLHVAEEIDLPAPEAEPVALAVVLDDPPEHPVAYDTADCYSERAEQFYRGVRQALAPGGITLAHTHTTVTTRGLHDPSATLIRAAQAVGLAYLQHIVIVHTRLDAPTTTRYRFVGQTPVPPACRRLHSDLYVLRKPQEASR